MKLINGISSGKDVMYSFGNGFGCAVAQFIEKIKDCVGNVYIYKLDSDEKWIDFSYVVNYDTKSEAYDVTIFCYDKEIFKGTMEEFLEFCNNPVYDDEEEDDIPSF